MAATVRQLTTPSGTIVRIPYVHIRLSDSDAATKLIWDCRRWTGFFESALNKDRTLQEPMVRAHMLAALVTGEGEVHVAELPGVGVVGIAVWFGPGHVYLDSDAQRNAGHNQVVKKLPTELQKWWKQFLSEYGTLTDRVLGPGVKLGGYHLQLIGVSPAHQRKGPYNRRPMHGGDYWRKQRGFDAA
uniref:Peptide synthase/polyketide synthase n=1 Tax=Ganoderma boninense TaxID=34458 RepID=A0A5K1K5S2_9APHY|nr:Putative peptide synthase/polyketide synthase [Ganoderma boninense]